MRLNRYISVSGFASRRKGEEVIRDGRVTVNGNIVTDPAFTVVPGRDRVVIDGRPLESPAERRYYLLNKPTGVIVSVGDTHGRPTVLDLLGPEAGRVFPVGRLDADTSGVLLLTDDGDLAFRLTHPSYGVDKIYRAEVRGKVDNEDVGRVAHGLVLDDGPTEPANLRILRSGAGKSVVELTLHQGRKRQVRRMLEHIGHTVLSLERISFGGITARGVPAGEYRALTADEVNRLKMASKTRRPSANGMVPQNPPRDEGIHE